MADKQIAQEVLKYLTEPRLNAFQQAHILVVAIESYIAKNRKFTVRQVRTLYAEMVGSGISDIKPYKEENLTGYVGEVVLYNGVNLFFENPAVRERYGYSEVSEQMKVLVSAEGYKGDIEFPDYRQRWLAEARRIFQDVVLRGQGGQSITDFFWREGVPVEHKAKLYERIVIGEKVKGTSTKFKKGALDNEYLKVLQQTRGGVVVGFTWVSVEYRRIDKASKDYQIFKKKLNSSLAAMSRRMKAPVVFGDLINKELDGIFEAVSVRVEGFMPMVVSSQGFQKELTKTINLAEANVDRKMLTKAIEENIRHIKELIERKKIRR